METYTYEQSGYKIDLVYKEWDLSDKDDKLFDDDDDISDIVSSFNETESVDHLPFLSVD